MAKYEIAQPTWGKKLQYATEALISSSNHFSKATTPGMKSYWLRIKEGSQRRVDELTSFINANPEKEDEPCDPIS